VDSPSPPLRSALGPSLTRKRYTPQESQLQTASLSRVRSDPFSGIQASHASSRRAPNRSSRQQRPSCSCAPRVHPSTRGIVRSVAAPPARSRERGSVSASYRQKELICGTAGLTVAPRSNDLLEGAADGSHRNVTTGSSTSRAASECTTSPVDNPLVEAGRARFWALVHSNQSLSRIIQLDQIVEIHREPSAHRNGPGCRRADVEAREWATFNARARVERVSREPL
jgi:hypothetical protein